MSKKKQILMDEETLEKMHDGMGLLPDIPWGNFVTACSEIIITFICEVFHR